MGLRGARFWGGAPGGKGSGVELRRGRRGGWREARCHCPLTKRRGPVATIRRTRVYGPAARIGLRGRAGRARALWTGSREFPSGAALERATPTTPRTVTVWRRCVDGSLTHHKPAVEAITGNGETHRAGPLMAAVGRVPYCSDRRPTPILAWARAREQLTSRRPPPDVGSSIVGRGSPRLENVMSRRVRRRLTTARLRAFAPS